MDYSKLKSIIEGLLFMAGDEGLTKKQLSDILELDATVAVDITNDLMKDLKSKKRGIQVSLVAGAYRLTTNPAHAPYFERMAYSPTRSSLSQAALETLSIVAYRQPITRIDIEEIRGVKSERPLHTLVAKDLIEEVGRAEAIGRPILYGTTKSFLEYFGLAGIDALPEPKAVDDDSLDEQTQLLFEKLEGRQMTIEELPPDSIKDIVAETE
ncbi:segregation and condensation protein B [Paenibacillus baekrokdamisoli]|uniref:Segregation and condensation protein B n=1 Tax=Paenibacillus baekrokdamisoli TaxID=1712516 RepID=A0A3G9IRL6_9BACL|nr:SMC-Scp complex subunit ScpB [Paenibacillus baekrokdamisoli]MBB3069600.1 segregation and condensation protein B [Paenibacillus baekrokdamisoli]BBH21046.1 segregation and condensation protein B [Paenibacillus baekrokdamisoli]